MRGRCLTLVGGRVLRETEERESGRVTMKCTGISKSNLTWPIIILCIDIDRESENTGQATAALN